MTGQPSGGFVADPAGAPPPQVYAPGSQGLQINLGGDNTLNNTFVLLPRPPVTWPHRVGVAPPVAHCWQERPADLALDAAGAGEVVVVCQVMTGLGGVGKTQLAAGLAHRLWDTGGLDLLVWVSASSRSGVVTAYAQAAADVTNIEDTDAEQAAARFLAWLATTA